MDSLSVLALIAGVISFIMAWVFIILTFGLMIKLMQYRRKVRLFVNHMERHVL